MNTIQDKGQGKKQENPEFNSYEQFLFPKELQKLILNDAEIKRIIDEELSPASAKYYKRVEQLRIEHDLTYNRTHYPIKHDVKANNSDLGADPDFSKLSSL